MKVATFLCASLLLTQLGFASELHLASHCDTAYTFSKHETVLLVKPSNASPVEDSNFQVLRESLLKAGFNLADSAAGVQRYLTYYIRTGGTFESRTRIGRSLVETRVDSSRTSVTLAMFDASAPELKQQKQKMIWQAALNVPDKDYEKAAADLLAKLLKLYGKNEVKTESFKVRK
ncbi:hypothetical protein C3F09_11665 [candidate division GN15 bacterium]|uniref:DUF4136 domain-containing protein n=1 Tax=candidate division GN15 bacterium TaxID=2072418 RepID=A0A855WWH0_9BACT|nr:MAG: hypothetical protein C3F09_11665 [candidate division GN15 bacterium]